MGVKRQQVWPDLTCNIVLVGDAKVGKTSLVHRAVSDKFSESYGKTSFHGGSGEKTEWNCTVSGRKVRYNIVDTSGGMRGLNSGGVGVGGPTSGSGHQAHVPHHRSSSSLSLTSCGSAYFESASARKTSLIYQRADIFLLCYKISDPASLFSALNFWCPEIRSHAPTTPIILVGCQSDMRSDRDVLATLARRGLAPVSADQGLTLSQQAGCLLYVETSAKMNGRSANSAFEVAALSLLGQLSSAKPFSISTSHLSDSPRNHGLLSGVVMPPPVPPKPNGVPITDSPMQTTITSNPPVVPPKPAARRALSTLALNTTNEMSLYRETNDFELDPYSPEPRHRFPHRTVGRRQPPASQNHLRQSCIDLNATTSSSTSSSTASSASSSGVVVAKRNAKYISASRGQLAMSPASPKLSFKTNRDRSVSSLLSIGVTHRTPKVARRGNGVTEEKTVTIRCQRLTADKRYEEVDVEVPAPIYETLRLYNNGDDSSNSNNGSSGGFLPRSKQQQQQPSPESQQRLNSASTDPLTGASGKNRSIAERIKSLFGTRN